MLLICKVQLTGGSTGVHRRAALLFPAAAPHAGHNMGSSGDESAVYPGQQVSRKREGWSYGFTHKNTVGCGASKMAESAQGSARR
eukprot:2213957-Prymnesium_polylepis.1